MPKIARSAQEMISQMTPQRREGVFVFAGVQDPARAAALAVDAIAGFAEAEGMSMILPLETARQAGLDVGQPMCCITLNVYSALEGVGLTAAVAGALGDAGIACNMVAAFHHDHVFVPEALAGQAMQVLTALQAKAGGAG